MLAVMAAACGTQTGAPRATPTPTPAPSISASPSPRPEPSSPPGYPAPVIVQVENSPFARPQSGLSRATRVYEYVAEGGVSRFSAMFTSPMPYRIGPVRSARLATLELLRLYQGVLLYSGADQYITGLLGASGLPHFDENGAGGDLFRIGERVPPHNLYTDGPHLTDLVGRVQPPTVTYASPSDVAPAPGGTPVSRFTVHVSNSENPVWTWGGSLRGWFRTEPDTGPVIDADTGRALLATTVVVQQVAIAVAPQVVDVNGVHGVMHTLTGTGAAQVFVDGMEFDATWTQPDAGPPRLTLANGQPAPLLTGAVWYELVPTGSPATLG